MAETMTKDEFVDVALKNGMLMFGKDPFTLKSGRQSRLFFNAGNADHGSALRYIEKAYAGIMGEDVGDKPVVCFGLPYKCINVASHAAAALCDAGHDARWNSYRKEEKGHGADAKSILVARADNIKMCGGRVAIVDDVITTGASKYDAKEVLDELAKQEEFNLDITGVYLLVDRQEVTTDNVYKSAITQLQDSTGMKTKAFITATELIEAARKKGIINDSQYKSFLTYFRVYGAPEVLATYDKSIDPKMMVQPFFMPTERAVIPACDFEDINLFEELVKATADVEKIGGYKVGSLLVEENGLGKVGDVAKKHAPKKALIYDGQKRGSDIPDMVYKQVKQYARHGYDAAIIFAMQGGPEALLAGIHSGYENGINIIVGAEMTHQGFSKADGGCIAEEDMLRFYKIAASRGIRNFVMPGTKPERIKFYREDFEKDGVRPIMVFSPGFVTQSGSIGPGGNAAGKYFQAIVGRGIYEKSPGQYRTADEMRTEAIKLTKQL